MLFSRGKKGVVGLDIGSSAIKLVELRERKGGVHLQRLGIEPLSPEAIVDGSIMDSSLVVDAIHRLNDHAKTKGTNYATATSLSGHSVIIKKIQLPAMTEEELASSIQWEAEQYIPFDINDVRLDYVVLTEGEPGRDNMEVLLVAVKKDKINDCVSVISRTDKQPTLVDVDAFAAQNAYEVNCELDPRKVVRQRYHRPLLAQHLLGSALFIWAPRHELNLPTEKYARSSHWLRRVTPYEHTPTGFCRVSTPFMSPIFVPLSVWHAPVKTKRALAICTRDQEKPLVTMAALRSDSILRQKLGLTSETFLPAQLKDRSCRGVMRSDHKRSQSLFRLQYRELADSRGGTANPASISEHGGGLSALLISMISTKNVAPTPSSSLSGCRLDIGFSATMDAAG